MAQTSHADLLSLLQLEERLDSGDLDAALKALDARRRKVFWQGMPERIVLVRHGELHPNPYPALGFFPREKNPHSHSRGRGPLPPHCCEYVPNPDRDLSLIHISEPTRPY